MNAAATVSACLVPFQLLVSAPGNPAASAVIQAQLDISDRNDCGPEFEGGAAAEVGTRATRCIT